MLPHIIALYKPVGMTSHDAVDCVRKITGKKRVGHAGTLDPLASGVLVVGIGREATKKLAGIAEGEKEYQVSITLGAASTTDDAEGEKTVVSVSAPPAREMAEEALRKFIGEIAQVPPAYSAVHTQGTRAYKLARKGRVVALAPRKVHIKEIELVDYAYPLLKLRVVCGKGVYIRSIARDIGEALGTGGYVSALERTRIGDFTLENTIPLADFRRTFNI